MRGPFYIRIAQKLEVADLRAIFKSPQFFLKKLDIGFNDFKAMSVLASGKVTALKCVKFRRPFPTGNEFASFAEKNESLSDVKIHMGAMVA